ncbi:RNA polymerase sigma factor [Fodinibius sediminis]|uniref:RNA polymerase, sigma-24 subunit, RpoE n=1 Tax=Fodinibius sediminis TaxID=1214077 RepID=A0A521CMH2_9BACT|nr:sigma-70 family RNA polymerase sigma factor [Fodinibius sediminis]SMO59951.1 RNA polymerase, sigma-24 subunit, RpoE [Fodinibius sediminis]
MINWFKRRRKKKTSYDTNEEWVEALKPPVDERAVELLREQLVRGLKPALHKYVDHELDQFVEDVAQDALLKVLDNIDSFRGDSKLLTWAMKIAVREGLTELRLKRYDNISIEDLKSRDSDTEIRSMNVADSQPSPDRSAHEAQLMEKMMTIMEEELTKKQKMVIQAVVINGLPPTVVAKQMGTNRNALYKVIYDARLKLKTRFELDGIDPDEMLNNM